MDTVVKFKADASEYNRAVREMINSNSKMASSVQSLNGRSFAGMGMNRAAMGGGAAAAGGGMGSMLFGIGTAAAAVVSVVGVQLTRAVMSFADEIQNAANKTGVGAEALQRWKLAAEASGGSLQTITNAFKKLRQAQADAQGGGKSGEAFAALGIDPNGNSEAVFNALGESLAKGEISGSRFAAAMKILGKNADEVIAIFRDGGFVGTGLTTATRENIKAVDDLGDAIGRLKQRFLAGGTNLLGRLLRGEAPGGNAVARTLSQLEAENDAETKSREQEAIEAARKQTEAEEAAKAKAQEDAKKTADLKARNDATQSKATFDALTPEQKRRRLTGEIAGLADTVNNFDLPELQRETARAALLEKQGQLSGLKMDKETAQSIGSDSMRRIGLFVGGGIGGRVSPELSELKAIRSAINRQSEVIKEAL